MTLGLYESDRRHRRRARAAFFRFVFYVALLIGVGMVAYRAGQERTQARLGALESEVQRLSAGREQAEQVALEAEATTQAIRMRYEDLVTRFEREVPSGTRAQMLALINQRLSEGLAPDRLTMFIKSAEAPKDCSEPSTKRFIMPTPLYSGANTSVGFDDGRVTVTGAGQNAVTQGGAPQGWFDPAQDVSVTFTMIGGAEETIAGRLPLHHALLFDGREYRFTVVEGDQRSFVEVTADSCSTGLAALQR